MNLILPYLERNGLIALEKRSKLATLIEELPFEFDLDGGVARFGPDLEFPAQVLGTESDNTVTWLWAWADAQEELPPAVIRSALELRAWARTKGVQEFLLPSVDLDHLTGDAAALIASEVCSASASYRSDYEGGALYLLLFDRRIEAQPGFGFAGFRHAVEELAARFDLDQRKTILSYFEQTGLPVTDRGETVTGRLPSGGSIIAEFDGQNRVVRIAGEEAP